MCICDVTGDDKALADVLYCSTTGFVLCTCDATGDDGPGENKTIKAHLETLKSCSDALEKLMTSTLANSQEKLFC